MLEESCYENQNFSGIEVTMDELARKRFLKCNFSNGDFSDLTIAYACIFDGCTFSNTRLNGVKFRNCQFLNCQFKFAGLFTTSFEECKMTGSSFIDADAEYFQISGGDWSYTELRYLKFVKQNLDHVNFNGADLTGTRFEKCSLRDCCFDEIATHELSFYGSDLRGATFQGTELLDIDFRKAKVDLKQCVALAEAVGAVYTEE